MLEMKHKPVSPAHSNEPKEPALKGTFVSVMLLGGFLALTWVTVF